jgi:hypothetical protein
VYHKSTCDPSRLNDISLQAATVLATLEELEIKPDPPLDTPTGVFP